MTGKKGVKEVKKELASFGKTNHPRQNRIKFYDYLSRVKNSDEYSSDAKKYASLVVANRRENYIQTLKPMFRDIQHSEAMAEDFLRAGQKGRAAKVYLALARATLYDDEPFGPPTMTKEKYKEEKKYYLKAREIYEDLGEKTKVRAINAVLNRQENNLERRTNSLTETKEADYLWKELFAFISLVGILTGIFFLFLGLSSNNVQLSPGANPANWQLFLGIGLLIVGLVAGFFWFSKKNNKKSVSKSSTSRKKKRR